QSVSDMIRLGRSARIGESVQGIYPTTDGQYLLIDHAGAPAEKLRTADLRAVESIPEIKQVSDLWGPNSHWRNFASAESVEIRDMRSGAKVPPDAAIPATADFTHFAAPSDPNQWIPVWRYREPRVFYAARYDKCFLHAVDDTS